mmetsp:Transcript_10870/g.29599  ORF Transcript_10870/g.29599 Transcript_10870/m.29599 type:complete len:224 (+) Transcript_10870:212-883(+)
MQGTPRLSEVAGGGRRSFGPRRRSSGRRCRRRVAASRERLPLLLALLSRSRSRESRPSPAAGLLLAPPPLRRHGRERVTTGLGRCVLPGGASSWLRSARARCGRRPPHIGLRELAPVGGVAGGLPELVPDLCVGLLELEACVVQLAVLVLQGAEAPHQDLQCPGAPAVVSQLVFRVLKDCEPADVLRERRLLGEQLLHARCRVAALVAVSLRGRRGARLVLRR